MPRRLQTPAFVFMALASVLIALSVLRFFAPEPQTSPGILVNRAENLTAFQLHVLFGGLALLVGPMQFVRRLRQARPRLHRLVGTAYVTACLVGGVTGFVLALGSRYGPVAVSGFAALAVVWIAVTLNAWSLALKGRYAEHERWMVRSFAVTFAAVTLRLMLVIGAVLQIPFDTVYPPTAWLCWTLNLAVVEAAFALAWADRMRRAAMPA